MESIVEKATNLLDQGLILEENLTREEFIIFRRVYKRAILDPMFLPYIEVEAWTTYTREELITLFKSIGCKVFDNSQNSEYPYKSWYLHGDGSIRIDFEKAKKLAGFGQIPVEIITVATNSNNFNGGHQEEPQSININSYTYQLLKDEDIIDSNLLDSIKSAKEVFQKVKEINLKLSGIEGQTELKVGYKLSAIEFSSPAIYNFKDLRKVFYLFKCKGKNNKPLLFVNKSCGLHISFQLPIQLNMEKKTNYLKRLVTLYTYLEPQIMEIVPDHRKNNNYCKLINQEFSSIKEVLNSILYTQDSWSNSNKYRALNISKARKQFQEFRFINATSDVNQIENWILFLQSICQYALSDNEIDSDIHIFDVITNLHLQNWFLKRKKHLNTKAIEDKSSSIGDIEPYSKIKTKRDELLKRKYSEKSMNSKKTGEVNSGSNSRKSILSASRFANAQAARRRIRSRRH